MAQDLSISRKFNWIALKNCTKETVGEYATGKAVISPDFKIPIGNVVSEWNLLFYPNGSSAEYSSHLSLFLNRKDSLELPYQAEVKMWIVSKTKRFGESSFTRSLIELKSHGFSKLISHQKLKQQFIEVVVNGNLELGLEITIKEGSGASTTPTSSNDFLKMFEESLFTDFKLVCSDGESLLCHKSVLAARSPVFKAMVSSKMKEAKQGLAKIPDFDSNIMRQVLRHMYNGKVESLDTIAKQLIFIAEMYQLEDLKKICIENIFKNLSKDNALDVLLMSEKISGCGFLIEQVIRVVARNYYEVMKTEKWNNLPRDTLQNLMEQVMAVSVETLIN